MKMELKKMSLTFETRRSLILFIAALAALTGCAKKLQASSPAQSSKLSRGHKWVRSHDFTIMGAVSDRYYPQTDYNPELYRDMGASYFLPWEFGRIDTFLKKNQQTNLPWFELVTFDYSTDYSAALFAKQKKESQSYSDNYRNFCGVTIMDEPSRQDMDTIRKIGDWYRQTFPDALVFTNLLPYIIPDETGQKRYYGAALPKGGYTYSDYIDDAIHVMKTDILMYDRYPFFKNGATSEIYFANMEAIRGKALKAGLPYWAWIQSYHHTGNAGYREPSGSDLSMQVFSHLTSGYTGISYFTYNDVIAPAIIKNDNTPNPLYHRVQEINAHVKNLGKVLKYLTSTDVRYVAGYHEQTQFASGFFAGKKIVQNDLPLGTTAWTPKAGNDSHIVDITVIERGEDKNALIGFFADDSGEKYFMFTNLKHGQNLSAEDCKLEFSITFDSTINELLTLNSTTGEQELLKLKNHTHKFTLGGGMGKLFKYNTGKSFVGIKAR